MDYNKMLRQAYLKDLCEEAEYQLHCEAYDRAFEEAMDKAKNFFIVTPAIGDEAQNNRNDNLLIDQLRENVDLFSMMFQHYHWYKDDPEKITSCLEWADGVAFSSNCREYADTKGLMGRAEKLGKKTYVFDIPKEE